MKCNNYIPLKKEIDYLVVMVVLVLVIEDDIQRQEGGGGRRSGNTATTNANANTTNSTNGKKNNSIKHLPRTRMIHNLGQGTLHISSIVLSRQIM